MAREYPPIMSRTLPAGGPTDVTDFSARNRPGPSGRDGKGGAQAGFLSWLGGGTGGAGSCGLGGGMEAPLASDDRFLSFPDADFDRLGLDTLTWCTGE